MRQVRRADEEHVDAVDGRDVVHLGDRGGGLDLDDAEGQLVDLADLAVTARAHPGSPGPERDPAGPLRRVAQVADRLADLRGGVEPRHHHPGRAEIEGTADAQPLAGLRADERGRRA